jgi:hypothetical protein
VGVILMWSVILMWRKRSFVSVLTIVLLYSCILIFVLTYNVAAMEYIIVFYVNAITDWLCNNEQTPIIIVIYKLCMCVLLFLKLWQVPREVSMYNFTIYIVFSRTFLYGRFSTCCRIRKSVISTKVIVFYTSFCQLSLHSPPQFLLSIKRFQWPILLELLFFAFKVSVNNFFSL